MKKDDFSWFRGAVPFAAFLVCARILPLPLLSAEANEGQKVSELRKLAYKKSGEWLYESLPQIKIPDLKKREIKDGSFSLPVDWKAQSFWNKRGLPLFEPSMLEYHDGSLSTKALLTGFLTRFHAQGPGLFRDFFAGVPRSKWLSPEQKKEMLDHEDLLRNNSMIFYLSYPLKEVQPIYYPGKLRFEGGARSGPKKWLPGTPSAIKNGSRTDYALIQNSQGLLALFNGTFDKLDNFVSWNEKGEMRYGGFGYDFKTMMEPQPEMATFAQYQDGHIILGTYERLQNKGNIRTFIQNRFMVIEDGVLAKDSDPNAYCSFDDDIARSYMFIDHKGRFGYLWSLYTPANVLAKIALEMGVKDMMLLDIHSPVSCVLSDPSSPLQCGDYEDYMRHSYDWVPNFFRLSSLEKTLTWISAAIHSRIQTHYVMEAFKGGTEAYFALFLKGSPEAQRVSRPRPAPAVQRTR